jgi:hypothetical protein
MLAFFPHIGALAPVHTHTHTVTHSLTHSHTHTHTQIVTQTHREVLSSVQASQVGDASTVNEGSNLLACKGNGGNDSGQLAIHGALLLLLLW